MLDHPGIRGFTILFMYLPINMMIASALYAGACRHSQAHMRSLWLQAFFPLGCGDELEISGDNSLLCSQPFMPSCWE